MCLFCIKQVATPKLNVETIPINMSVVKWKNLGNMALMETEGRMRGQGSVYHFNCYSGRIKLLVIQLYLDFVFLYACIFLFPAFRLHTGSAFVHLIFPH